MRKINFADLFCGAGGTSVGAEMTGEARARFAVNHWDVAIETHSANHPHCQHVRSRLNDVRPSECTDRIDLLFASPECIHHSRARGGRPTSDQQRSGAWEIMPWIEHHRPSWVVIENVSEFQSWGPVDSTSGSPLKSHTGKYFEAWLAAIKAGGYRVEVGCLNAADFGAATSRNRLFVIARKGNRPAPWPEPTHSRNPGRALPGMQRLPWRPAYEIIDWSIPCPSIFSRTRPLADKTLLRIEAGLRRFVEPFVVTLRNHGNGSSVEGPIAAITAGGNHHGLAVPYIFGCGGRDAQSPPTGMDSALNTIVCKDAKSIAVPYLASVNHGDDGRTGDRLSPLERPLGTITARNGRAVVLPFLSSYYGNGDCSSIDSPTPTIVTKDRHSVITALIQPMGIPWPEPASDAMRKLQATMRELGVVDIGFRMLSNPELSTAQSFPAEYLFAGTKADITRQIGNSVAPAVACGITKSLLSV